MMFTVVAVVVLFVHITYAQLPVSLGKSTGSSNYIIRYAADNSLRLDSWQQQLIQETGRRYGSMMMGAPEVVQLNQLLMRSIGAKNVLDVGLFTGYSALGAALTIPNDGKVIGMDIVPQYWNNVGQPIAQQAGVGHKIQAIFQPAKTTMDQLIANGTSGQWDFCFIDADKENQGVYYEQCLTLLRPGGIIAIDNSLWGGSVARGPHSVGSSTWTIDQLNKRIHNDTRVWSSLLVIADGLNVALKL